MTAEEQNAEVSRSEIARWNWGALGLTPLWLIRNGFLITALLYLIIAHYLPLLNIVIGLLFFWRGTRWSWGNGRRWKTYEEFADSQHAWNFAGKIACFLLALWICHALLRLLQALGYVDHGI